MRGNLPLLGHKREPRYNKLSENSRPTKTKGFKLTYDQLACIIIVHFYLSP